MWAVRDGLHDQVTMMVHDPPYFFSELPLLHSKLPLKHLHVVSDRNVGIVGFERLQVKCTASTRWHRGGGSRIRVVSIQGQPGEQLFIGEDLLSPAKKLYAPLEGLFVPSIALMEQSYDCVDSTEQCERRERCVDVDEETHF